ncbi:creatininase family protein [Streptomyces sp. NPDC001530]|uniref:creatininase family protein n=1 Tax=Streptomyces sp. NPDC001530 TaxID=3364582 RepID=UPI0036A97A8C
MTPSVPTGLSEHHMAFGGTLTLGLPTLHALLRDIRSVFRVGFSRILIVNGHGGNMTALNALTTELSAPIAFASYFGVGRGVVRDTLETQDGLMHACDGETSMMMAAFPELIRTEHLDEAHGPHITLPAESTEPVYMAVPSTGSPSPGSRATPGWQARRRASGCCPAVRRHWRTASCGTRGQNSATRPTWSSAAHVCAAGKGVALPGRAGVQDSPRLGRRQFGRGKWQV